MILALDFDGVICDSVRECLDTSYRAYRSCHPEESLPEQPMASWSAAFLERRGMVRPSGHYYTLWQWILRRPELRLSPDEFEAMAEAESAATSKFEETFHRVRDKMRVLSPQAFVLANPLYPGVAEVWSQLVTPRYVVSAKDEPSVRLILEAHQLTVDGIYGRGSGSKPSTLRLLADRYGVSIQDVLFVDDNALHVADAAHVGATAMLATWGYGPWTPAPAVCLEHFSELIKVGQLRTGN